MIGNRIDEIKETFTRSFLLRIIKIETIINIKELAKIEFIFNKLFKIVIKKIIAITSEISFILTINLNKLTELILYFCFLLIIK